MRPAFNTFLVSLLFLPCVGLCQVSSEAGQVSQSPQVEPTNSFNEILEASRDRSQLEMAGGAPFHLVASFEQFDAAGNSMGRGSIDELWETPYRYRLSLSLPPLHSAASNEVHDGQRIDLPARTLVEVDNGTLLWRSGQWVIPGEIGKEPTLAPFYRRSNLADELSLESAPKSNPDLDCIGSQPKLPGVASGTQLALTTYCLQRGNHLLRLMLLPHSEEIGFNDLQAFGAKFVARTIQIAIHGKIRLKLHVDLLETATDFTVLDAAPPDSAHVFHFHRADETFRSTEVMVGQWLSGSAPMYPHDGLDGAITVKLQVGTTGEVQSASVLEAQNQALKAPVLAAVKSWRFRVSYQGTKLVPVDYIYIFRFGGFQEVN